MSGVNAWVQSFMCMQPWFAWCRMTTFHRSFSFYRSLERLPIHVGSTQKAGNSWSWCAFVSAGMQACQCSSPTLRSITPTHMPRVHPCMIAPRLPLPLAQTNGHMRLETQMHSRYAIKRLRWVWQYTSWGEYGNIEVDVSTAIYRLRWVLQYRGWGEYGNIVVEMRTAIQRLRWGRQYRVWGKYGNTEVKVSTAIYGLRWGRQYRGWGEYDNREVEVSTAIQRLMWVQQHTGWDEYGNIQVEVSTTAQSIHTSIPKTCDRVLYHFN